MVLGIDLGTSRIKVVLVDPSGAQVASAAVATPFATHGGRVEMSVDALRESVAEAVAALGVARARVVAVGVAGMAESGAPLDVAGRALAPVIAWHDRRGQDTVEELERRFDEELPLRIGQRIRTVLTVSKLGWLIGHGMNGMVHWLGVPELVLHTLTGEAATEYSLAARTGCYDVATRQWIPEVAGALGFSVDVFPGVRPAGAVMGGSAPAPPPGSDCPRVSP